MKKVYKVLEDVLQWIVVLLFGAIIVLFHKKEYEAESESDMLGGTYYWEDLVWLVFYNVVSWAVLISVYTLIQFLIFVW